ncbi:MAG: hypothetical protein M5U28_06105 [Sandaracinaceae bacterium]|nr:hypothetical protein [Sandaracinaceae bacterium]
MRDVLGVTARVGGRVASGAARVVGGAALGARVEGAVTVPAAALADAVGGKETDGAVAGPRLATDLGALAACARCCSSAAAMARAESKRSSGRFFMARRTISTSGPGSEGTMLPGSVGSLSWMSMSSRASDDKKGGRPVSML